MSAVNLWKALQPVSCTTHGGKSPRWVSVGIEENLVVNVEEDSLSQPSSTLLNKISETLTALLHSFSWSTRLLFIGDRDGDFHTATEKGRHHGLSE